jgi:hypothetical protein
LVEKDFTHCCFPNPKCIILGRLITYNVSVVFEALRMMNKRMGGKQGFMALKLDMSKAYDRVE